MRVSVAWSFLSKYIESIEEAVISYMSMKQECETGCYEFNDDNDNPFAEICIVLLEMLSGMRFSQVSSASSSEACELQDVLLALNLAAVGNI